ncbi:MAG: 16S rRNA (uracil(1498)-N(3))-methyltransferase [Gluconacetobacter diazotrophicus]|nr:16S rRNA (uracil(1498)-N(3))-methyltransferase [Gluconacetobacter diazotrophicus]
MQDAPRLHLDPDDAPLAAGAALDLPPGHARYLGTVLRKAPGDPVRLFNARDGEWDATITALRKDRAAIRLDALRRAPAPEPGPVLLFAPLKRDATDLVLRMATELGVSRIVPVVTGRTNAGRTNPERWRAIAVEAAEQCERLSVPAIDPPRPLFDLLGDWDPVVPLLLALERAGTAPQSPAAWRRARSAADAAAEPAILVGPEGGFSPAERDTLLSRPFVVPVSLGPTVLRADTAVAAALASLRG